MDSQVVIPVYARIALDIATRISKGEIKEHTKLYGRSVLSSEYGVSPETIRKSMKLLSDMEIIEIIKNSGSVVISCQKAQKYVEVFGEQNNPRVLKKKLSELVKKQAEINQKIQEMANAVIEVNDKYSPTNPFINYEERIIENSYIVGKSLGEIKFWQETKATVIAVKRDGLIILSPGPYFTFNVEDILIYVGDVTSVEAVKEYLKKGNKN